LVGGASWWVVDGFVAVWAVDWVVVGFLVSFVVFAGFAVVGWFWFCVWGWDFCGVWVLFGFVCGFLDCWGWCVVFLWGSICSLVGESLWVSVGVSWIFCLSWVVLFSIMSAICLVVDWVVRMIWASSSCLMMGFDARRSFVIWLSRFMCVV